MKKTFFSNGKLLLTGEYVVLDGASALAMPTRYGQYLDIEDRKENIISWISYDADGSIWFEEQFQLSAIFENRQDSEKSETNTLINILHKAWLASPELLDTTEGFTVTTRLTFPRHWGLGTSSTLINNIAQWFDINAFDLLAQSFGGSGYDIACAQNDTPILYRLEDGQPIIEQAVFNPAFADNLYFVYLNRKQSSRQAITAYNEHRRGIAPFRAKIDLLTQRILKAASLSDFCTAIEEHEAIMSGVLKLPAVKTLVFPDFNGTVKSLGAWGGDFLLAAANENPESYFISKGFDIVIPYRDMILNAGTDLSENGF